MRVLGLICGLLLWAGGAWAQNQPQPVATQPVQGGSVNASGTIATTGTFQSVIATAIGSGRSRQGCLVQNIGSNTMFVFFGPIASATTPTGFQLTSGSSINCTVGVSIASDQVSIAGTSGDRFVASWQ